MSKFAGISAIHGLFVVFVAAQPGHAQLHSVPPAPALLPSAASEATPPRLVQPKPPSTVDQPLASPVLAPDTNPSGSSDSSARLQSLVSYIVRENLPDRYEDAEDWGKTTRIQSGLRIWREGLQIKTKRQWKEVRHGDWQRVRIRLIDPERQFQMGIENLREASQGRVELDLWVDAALEVEAHWAHWEYGIQLASLSATAHAIVRLQVHCELGVRLDPAQLTPAVRLDPTVTAADLRLVRFRLKRIGQIGGDIAEGLGKAMQETLEDQLENRQKQLVKQLNKQIDKNRDSLELSLQDLLSSPWGSFANAFLKSSSDDD